MKRLISLLKSRFNPNRFKPTTKMEWAVLIVFGLIFVCILILAILMNNTVGLTGIDTSKFKYEPDTSPRKVLMRYLDLQKAGAKESSLSYFCFQDNATSFYVLEDYKIIKEDKVSDQTTVFTVVITSHTKGGAEIKKEWRISVIDRQTKPGVPDSCIAIVHEND